MPISAITQKGLKAEWQRESQIESPGWNIAEGVRQCHQADKISTFGCATPLNFAYPVPLKVPWMPKHKSNSHKLQLFSGIWVSISMALVTPANTSIKVNQICSTSRAKTLGKEVEGTFLLLPYLSLMSPQASKPLIMKIRLLCWRAQQ